ncbi:MAG: ntpA [Chlamydiales bacterium]|jgi:V/A-type H+-transporting ATPase subunit A|nr:ntpA [Chlamydiales bacterium]
MTSTQSSTGKVIKAFGNLLQVRFEGNIRQGAIAMVHLQDQVLKAEVIEIVGNEAKIQVFEDTREIALNTHVTFQNELLEAELGPGLLTSIVDGLQNPLQEIAEKAGYFLNRGIYFAPLDHNKKWNYTPIAKVGDRLLRGDTLGSVPEQRFTHNIMIPFTLHSQYTITWTAAAGSYTIDEVIAKAKDEHGKEHSFTMVQKWPVKKALFEGDRIRVEEAMTTGCRAIDTQFPVMKGGTFCTPGPFGAGKTVLQHHLSKYSSVDIVVIVACGERAGEVVEVLREFPHLIDPYTNEPLINRTVIICNTSSMPVAARESSVYMGVTIAEYYRQMGLNVLLLADSTSRWAQALREMSGRLEEIPGEEAFPAYLSSRIAEFYERSGAVQLKNGKKGSLTIGGSVSPAGGNFEEPVTQATLAVVGAFLGLSKARADARRFPSIDPLISWSKYIEAVGKKLEGNIANWSDKVREFGRLLKQGDDIGKRMEVVGEEGTLLSDMELYLKAEIYDFCYLQQNFYDKEDVYNPTKRQLALFQIMYQILHTRFKFQTHDALRQFFLSLQNTIKNLNFLPFETPEYEKEIIKIKSMIDSAKKIEQAQV